MKALIVLFETNMKLAVREFSGVLFGILLPMGIMLLLGIIYGGKSAFPGADYTLMQQAFAGVTAVGICASGLMGLPLTLADYREKKVLKRFKVTPTSPGVMLAAQVGTSLVFAVISSLLVWLTAKLFFGYSMPGSALLFIGAYGLVVLSIFSIGMVITSVSRNIKTVNLLCSLIYFPMFFLSGATIPYEIMPRGLQWAADFMPLTQGIKLLKGISLNTPLESTAAPVLILAATGILGILISLKTFRWE